MNVRFVFLVSLFLLVLSSDGGGAPEVERWNRTSIKGLHISTSDMLFLDPIFPGEESTFTIRFFNSGDVELTLQFSGKPLGVQDAHLLQYQPETLTLAPEEKKDVEFSLKGEETPCESCNDGGRFSGMILVSEVTTVKKTTRILYKCMVKKPFSIDEFVWLKGNWDGGYSGSIRMVAADGSLPWKLVVQDGMTLSKKAAVEEGGTIQTNQEWLVTVDADARERIQWIHCEPAIDSVERTRIGLLYHDNSDVAKGKTLWLNDLEAGKKIVVARPYIPKSDAHKLVTHIEFLDAEFLTAGVDPSTSHIFVQHKPGTKIPAEGNWTLTVTTNFPFLPEVSIALRVRVPKSTDISEASKDDDPLQ